MKVKIPFNDRFETEMMYGQKTWTSRNKRYGEIGDTFEAFNETFRIVGILRLPLKEVAQHYEEEGFRNKVDLIAFWCKIHPRKGYVAEQLVWVHVFKKLLEASKMVKE